MFRHRQQVSTANRAHETGIYTCSCCGLALFEASRKFEVGSGFPSFWGQIEGHVIHKPLSSYGRDRTQLLCGNCGQHLGHLFTDKRTPTQVRYCINQSAIRLTGQHRDCTS
ncbi:peptide-methionine (R)-S-oxide reductase [Pontibacter ramchanderi]|uniref:peptide-methionine (R)-S-oxide reductase n=1 Tax=Pontibacter ramchanderi TaxID=1179743 RepID=A0A2N3UCY7_9BACT|nr:peptide-methionine (R)-S-oxide reductase [Pontibacter ramchanderi]PKV67240.1 peptide-methionine (R)-S-oxide reductase [Pontibacter ramchanderi]